MGQTTWIPYNQHAERRKWLLADGSIVTEPQMEQSGSGIKVRVPGTDLSTYTKNVDTLVLDTVDHLAEALGTERWMPISDMEAKIDRTMGFQPYDTKAALHALDNDVKAKTRVWFRFKHASLPIEAMLVVTAARVQGQPSNHVVAGSLFAPKTHARRGLSTVIAQETVGSFPLFINSIDMDKRSVARGFIEASPPTWAPGSFLGSRQYTSERHMVEEVLRLVRHADDLETIQIPDLRDPDTPGWLDLEFDGTNLNGEFMSDLQEYLEGKPSAQRAAELYSELRDCLRTLGVVFDEAKEDDFSRGLLAGTLSVDCGTIHGDDGDPESEHTLSMDLLSGTFVVNCSLRVQTGDVAYAWNEAKAIASMTGDEPELLAFAREAARRDGEERAKKIIKQRRKNLN